ncbi:MAG: DUF1289 domain-containing protein [Nevskia sp.]|nr:DUF1289 domain-containing protein [Nevskia sp.]
MEVPSPCVKVCILGSDKVCIGCGRHIDEIADWGGAPPAVRLRIAAAARERLLLQQAQRPKQSANERK